MSLVETNTTRPVATYSVREVEDTIEDLLAEQLHHERDRVHAAADEIGLDPELRNAVLGDFQAWADSYDLPTSPHVMSLYIVELHDFYGSDYEALREVAMAYLFKHALDVRTPVLAALAHCATAPRAIEHRKTH
jgi:hypothetical protein